MTRAALVVSVIAILVSTAASVGQTVSPYVGQERRAIKALSEEEIRDLLDGRGMGLAKAAELNSYPGPLHVLQLKTELGLSDSQRATTESLYAEMRNKALPIGRKIIEAEQTLDQAFANSRIDPTILQAQVNAIAVLQGELRTVHLQTHLAQRALLTLEQVSRYNTLRGYGGNRAPHAHDQHGG